MRGPQFSSSYWKSPEATREVFRDGWYWSGDVAVRDEDGFYKIVDRRKEMIKYKGFPIAPAEVEAVLLEHPAVRDCGVIGLPDDSAGEIPCAFIVLRETHSACSQLETDICGYVGERLTGYKQPRQVRFVATIPRNPSGKILTERLARLSSIKSAAEAALSSCGQTKLYLVFGAFFVPILQVSETISTLVASR